MHFKCREKSSSRQSLILSKELNFSWCNFTSFCKKDLYYNTTLSPHWGSILFFLIKWLTKSFKLLIRFDSSFYDVMNSELKTHAFLTITESIGIFSDNFSIVAVKHFLTLFMKAKTQVLETSSLLSNSCIWV